MKQPLIAIFVVCALGIAGLAIWRFWPTAATHNNTANTPSNDATPNDNGFEYVEEELEDLPSREPAYLAPLNGTLVSDPEVWVVWKTRERSKCRLIATTDLNLWKVVGSTTARVHYLLLNLADFNRSAIFAVEFDDEGNRWRSQNAVLTLKQGASFAVRETTLHVDASENQNFKLKLASNNGAEIGGNIAMKFWCDDPEVIVYQAPGQDNWFYFGVQDGSKVPTDTGSVVFLELHDKANNTHDRMLIHLTRK